MKYYRILWDSGSTHVTTFGKNWIDENGNYTNEHVVAVSEIKFWDYLKQAIKDEWRAVYVAGGVLNYYYYNSKLDKFIRKLLKKPRRETW